MSTYYIIETLDIDARAPEGAWRVVLDDEDGEPVSFDSMAKPHSYASGMGAVEGECRISERVFP